MVPETPQEAGNWLRGRRKIKNTSKLPGMSPGTLDQWQVHNSIPAIISPMWETDDKKQLPWQRLLPPEKKQTPCLAFPFFLNKMHYMGRHFVLIPKALYLSMQPCKCLGHCSVRWLLHSFLLLFRVANSCGVIVEMSLMWAYD